MRLPREEGAAFGLGPGKPRLLSHPRTEPSAFPSSSSSLKAGFGEIDIMLDAAEDFVVDRLVVPQGDDGVAFCVQGFAGYLFKLPRVQPPDAIFVRSFPAQL